MIFLLVLGLRKILLRFFLKTQNRLYYNVAGIISFISVGLVPTLLSQTEMRSVLGSFGMIFLLIYFPFSMPKLYLKENGKFSFSKKD